MSSYGPCGVTVGGTGCSASGEQCVRSSVLWSPGQAGGAPAPFTECPAPGVLLVYVGFEADASFGAAEKIRGPNVRIVSYYAFVPTICLCPFVHMCTYVYIIYVYMRPVYGVRIVSYHVFVPTTCLCKLVHMCT